MPTENNPKMDELLKRYARQRRAEGEPPLEVDPATRRLLQAEVARTFFGPQRTRSARLISLEDFWPRLLLGGAGIAALVMAAGLWLRYDEKRDLEVTRSRDSNLFMFAQSVPENANGAAALPAQPLPEQFRGFELAAGGSPDTAKQDPSADKTSVPVSQKAEALATAPISEGLGTGRAEVALAQPITPSANEPDSLTDGRRFQYGLVPQARKDATSLAAAAATDSVELAAAQNQAGSAPQALAGLRRQLKQGSHLAEATSTEAAQAKTVAALDSVVGNTPALALNQAISKEGQLAPTVVALQNGKQRNQALSFRQIDPRARYRQNLNSPPAPKVLTRFELQRIGQQLRIVDADGSVYEGAVQSTNPQTPGDMVEPVSFRATGTNRTLQQNIVFTGNLVPSAQTTALGKMGQPIPAQQARSARFSKSSAALTENQAPAQVLAPFRIQGSASIGGTEQLKIEAEQVGP